MSKITISGHSFGGSVSFYAALKDQRIRCIVANDPYMSLVNSDQNVKDVFDVSDRVIFVQETQYFKDMMETDMFNKQDEFIKHNVAKSNQAWVNVMGHGHLHPCDWAALDP